MLKPSTQRPLNIFLILACFSFLSELKSQCYTPDPLPTVQCENAPLLCMQDACFATTNEADQGWVGFCGSNTVIHNPQYFEIIPTEECIQINIHIDGCNGGLFLQAALVTSCVWQPCPGGNVPCADVLDCDPGTPVGGTMIIDACDLVPGESLWLLIDGSSGAICQYTITYTEGILQPTIAEELTSGVATPAIVCQGQQNVVLSANPEIANAHGYAWHLEWNDQTITSDNNETFIDIEQDAPLGNWDVCVSAFSGCDTTDNSFCFPLEILESAITTEASLCCGGTVCGLCTDLELHFTGDGPWGVVISDGNALDTIEGIETSPYMHHVCRDFPAFVEYSIVEILTPADDCSTAIVGGQIAVHFFEPGLPSDWPWFFQMDSNTLCALTGYSGYSWHTCSDSTVISTAECIDIEADGCYCIDILFIDSCVYTWCSDILLSTEGPATSEFTIVPNPSNGKINIGLADTKNLPVEWTLHDHQGREINSGTITKSDTELNFGEEVASGLYFIVLENETYRVVRKVVFTK